MPAKTATERRAESPALPVVQLACLDLAAASGIRRRGDRLYVIADDEFALGVYDLDGRPLDRIPLVAGALPDEHAERKAHKPDFEALASLPDGSLLALGSGSTLRRRRAVRVEFAPAPRVQVFELDALYGALARELPELNLEGGAVRGDRLWLCSRGNSARRDDALIELALEPIVTALRAGRAPDAGALVAVRRLSLGEFDGAPLSLTDLAVLRGELVFTAAAEASPNTYDDGVTTGSVVGRLAVGAATSPPEFVGWIAEVKLEGLCPASDDPNESSVFLVADADDRGSRAPLFRAGLD